MKNRLSNQIINIRKVRAGDLDALVNLHHKRLPGNDPSTLVPFVTYGYYKTTIDSPFGFTLVAVDENEDLLGFIMGATHPALHSRLVLKQNWMRMIFGVLVKIFDRKVRAMAMKKFIGLLKSKCMKSAHMDKSVDSLNMDGTLTYVAIDNAAEGLGVFTKLQTSFFEIMRQHKVKNVMLYVFSDNQNARNIYEHTGWKQINVCNSKCSYSYNLQGKNEM